MNILIYPLLTVLLLPVSVSAHPRDNHEPSPITQDKKVTNSKAGCMGCHRSPTAPNYR